jgi:phage tail sheath protein FI
MAFQISPGVNVSEVDLTTAVPSVSTTAGAFAGPFQWGPVGQRTLVTNETDLVNKFGQPNGNTATSFFSAANFLAYGNNLQVVRAANSNSRNASSNTNNLLTINNVDVYDTTYVVDTLGQSFVARYPGALGNSLRVSVWDSNTANANATGSTFTSWTYKSYFPAAPTTSSYVSTSGGANDQIHLVVVDEDGLFSQGAKGTVLEVFPYLSKASDATNDDGSTSYYRTVLRNQSKYIYALGPVDNANTSGTWGQTANTQFGGCFMAANNVGSTASFGSGSDLVLTATDYTTGYGEFTNPDAVDISLIITGDAGAPSNTVSAITAVTTVQQYTIDSIASARKDCVTFLSPPQSGIVGGATPETTVTSWISTLARASTYAFADCGWKYQFDKYNNVYRWIPLNGDIAGLCVRTDQTRDPWFSPAGVNRGAIKNVVKLAWNPTQAQRDAIYSVGVNPVVSFPGQGTILYGDKTMVTQPSAFNRINVRRLFIVLEKAISTASKYSLFELNDEFTRAQFVALVEPFLRDVKGRRGIYDYRVVCDTTNNTPEVIDANKFVGDIYIKPARSVNYIQLNFVAVRTGVSFNEIVGSV